MAWGLRRRSHQQHCKLAADWSCKFAMLLVVAQQKTLYKDLELRPRGFAGHSFPFVHSLRLIMKLHAILLALYAVSGYSAKLVARQETYPEDNCWRAVWGNALDRRATRRVIEDCQSHLTTRVVTSTYSL